MTAASSRKRIILLDAHAILHRAYHALPDFATAKGEPTGALYGLSAMLIKIVEDLKPDYMIACYDVAAPTYRHEAYKEYKLGRKKAEDDLISQMKRSREVVEALNIPIYDKAGFEADDVIGTIVEKLKGDKKTLEVIIASGDMDTMQLISGKDVLVYTLKKGINDTIMYDEDRVRERFGFGPELIPDYKGLSGDPSDNIIGVKGIGDITATSLIKTFGTVEGIYKELDASHEEKFEKAGIKPRIIQLLKDNKEDAEFSKMLATIRRDVPIDFVIPEKTFKEALDIHKAKALWTELEFRTLGQRIENVLAGKETRSKKPGAKDGEPGAGSLESGEGSMKGGVRSTEKVGKSSKIGTSGGGGASHDSMFDKISSDELEKTGLALWLVNSNVTNPTLEDILNFGNTDDYETAKAAIFTALDQRDLRKVYETVELPLIPITKKMQLRGIKIDRMVLQRLSVTYHKETASLEKRIWEAAGMEFNINSPKQLGEVLFDKLGLKVKNMKKTSGGARSTKESELEKLRDLHPIVPFLFEYRELQKLLSTYIDAIPPLLDKNDRLHTTFISAGSTTGRMASQNPNLQNIPIRSDLGKAIREAFIAENGFVLVSFDYSQMELRIAAFLSGDEKLIEIFRKGEDVHTSVAAHVFKVSPSDVTTEMRRRAKIINFGIIYGMGVLALKQNLGTTREEAQQFLNDYFETFSTLANYLNRVKAETARKGYTETFFGRRRYFEGIHSRISYIKAQAERMAVNAPIQGTEADIIKLAMIRIDKYISDKKLEKDVHPLLQVHDELIYEISENKAKKITPEIEKIMESIIDPKETSGIVMKAKAATGKHWGELK